jgi:predicted Zn-dependent peptidase
VIAVQQVRNEILPGVFLTCLQTDKFKTGLLSVNFLTPLQRDTAAQNTLIPNVLRRGTVQYGDMDALAEKLDSLYGTRLEPIARKKGEIQAIGFWADFVDDAYLPGGEKLLEEVISLLGQVILSPNTRGGLLRKDYVESEKEKLLEDIRARVNDKISYSRFRLVELMCQMEDYAVDVLGTEDTASSIGYVALTKHYHEILATSPVEIFYCGTATPERVTAALQEALAPMPRGEINYDLGTDIRMNTLEEQTRYVTETMDVTQGKLALGFRLGEVMDDPDMAALRVMNTIFGGGVSSKLFLNVREKMSLCYFASSALDLMKGILVVISGIEIENYQTALDEIFRQLEAVKAGDITPQELAVAKTSLVSDLLSMTDSAGELEGFWLGQTLLGLDYGPEELAALVEDVTMEDVVKAASGIVCDLVYFMTGNEEENADEQA